MIAAFMYTRLYCAYRVRDASVICDSAIMTAAEREVFEKYDAWDVCFHIKWKNYNHAPISQCLCAQMQPHANNVHFSDVWMCQYIWCGIIIGRTYTWKNCCLISARPKWRCCSITLHFNSRKSASAAQGHSTQLTTHFSSSDCEYAHMIILYHIHIIHAYRQSIWKRSPWAIKPRVNDANRAIP